VKPVKPLVEFTWIVVILVTAIYLRVYHLVLSPGWYIDEGAFIDVAHQLANGHWGYFAIRGSPLLVGRPPVFFYVLATGFRLFGVQILVLRGFAVVCGIASILILYWIVRKLYGARLALLAAGLLAVYPLAVALNRIGLSYHLLAPLVLINFYANLQVGHNRRLIWLLVAGLTAGLALGTDYLGLVSVVLTLAVQGLSGLRRLVLTILLICGAVGLWLAPVAVADLSGLLYDLEYTFSRVSLPLSTQLVNVLIYYGHLLQEETWILAGWVGILLLPKPAVRWGLVVLFIGMILLLVRISVPPQHHLIPLLPLGCLGIAQLMNTGYEWINRRIRSELLILFPRKSLMFVPALLKRWVVPITGHSVAIFCVLSPLLWMLSASLTEVRIGSLILNGPRVIHEAYAPGVQVMTVVERLNKELASDDYTIASPNVAWALSGQVIDFQQAVACAGGEAYALPELGRERFAFDCVTVKAQFAVVDDLWRSWARRTMPDIEYLLVEVENWPLAFSVGDIDVYRNPESVSGVYRGFQFSNPPNSRQYE
jgi:hypothetical protein